MSRYGVISGLHFPVFSANTGKSRPEITPYLDSFHAVLLSTGFSIYSEFSEEVAERFSTKKVLRQSPNKSIDKEKGSFLENFRKCAHSQ